jgi:RNA polymerase sigma factor (sigma-70 family)
VDDNEHVIRRAQNGDSNAFESVYRIYKPYVHQIVARFKMRDSENTVQDIFVSVWLALPRFEWRSQFKTWLTSIAVRHCLSVIRNQPPARELLLSEMNSEEAYLENFFTRRSRSLPLEEDLLAREVEGLVRKSLSEFSSIKDRDAFLINQLNQVPESDAAAMIGCTVGQLRARVARAKARLRLDLARIFKRSI